MRRFLTRVPTSIAVTAALLASACARHIPEPPSLAPGTPYVSWVIMSGDRDNPDREFVCQSDPRNDCVIPVSRPDDQVFADVHIYYHGTGAEAKYTGTIDIGFFQGSSASHAIQANTTVKKNESIMSHSVAGIVTATPGRYAVAFSLVATLTDTGKSQPVQHQVPVVVTASAAAALHGTRPAPAHLVTFADMSRPRHGHSPCASVSKSLSACGSFASR